jgi:hypothetical protein
MSTFHLNGIIIPCDNKENNRKLCNEVLAINGINTSKWRYDWIELWEDINGVEEVVMFVSVSNNSVPYKKLVSIFKPYGFKVVHYSKFRKIFHGISTCDTNFGDDPVIEYDSEEEEDVIVEEEIVEDEEDDEEDEYNIKEYRTVCHVYNDLYDEGEKHTDYVVKQPKDLAKHYRALTKHLKSLDEDLLYHLCGFYLHDAYYDQFDNNVLELTYILNSMAHAIEQDRKIRKKFIKDQKHLDTFIKTIKEAIQEDRAK